MLVKFPWLPSLRILGVTLALLVSAFVISACSDPGAETAAPPVGGTPPASPDPDPTRAPTTPTGPRSLVVMTHDSFAISEELLVQFETENNVQVRILQGGDTGTTLNNAILARNNPIADVFFGVDNTFLSRALNEGIFEPYESPLLAQVPEQFKLDPQYRAIPVDYGDVCANYDISYFESNGLPLPANLEDLAKPEYRSLTVVQNPATSSPGLAFLLATVGHFGENGWLQYWQDLVANDVLVVNDWNSAYYGEFTRAGGTRPIVISYGSSPAFEVLYADPPVDRAPTGVITANGSCFRQIEFAGILTGTQNRDLAEKWIDFMLSPAFQEDIPLQMFVFPVNENAALADVFVEHLSLPAETAFVSPEAITANREAWIRVWTETVLR